VSERQDHTSNEENRLLGVVDGAVHLLDRQLLDCDGEMLGKVDDLELAEGAAGVTVTAVLTGTAAWLDRLGGRLGGHLSDRYRRLRPAEPHWGWPWRISFDDVQRLDSALHLSVPRDGLLRRDRDGLRFGRLTGMSVLDPDGDRIGRVLDGRFAPLAEARGGLVLTSLIVGRGRHGSLLGYDRREAQGPWLVRTAVGRLHRHTFIVDASVADIDWQVAAVRLEHTSTRPPGHAFD
jgi:sporulation protein YlmC with PRC-barrel domain